MLSMNNPRFSFKKGVKVPQLTEKNLRRSLIFNTVATLLKRRLLHTYFPREFLEIFSDTFLTKHPRGLFLSYIILSILPNISKVYVSFASFQRVFQNRCFS